MYPEISEQERFPILTDAGRKLLYQMRQHVHAPIWNWPNGEQLDLLGLDIVNRFAASLKNSHSLHSDEASADLPDWLDPFTEYCLNAVPFYRNRARTTERNPSSSFSNQPTCCREDLAPKVWDFVPDDTTLEQLIVFSTSGTTGHPTRMLSHPATAACGVPLIEAAVQKLSISIPTGPDCVPITNVASYRGAFTTAIVVAYLKEAGCVRVNLHPSAWRSTSDRTAFINQWRSTIWLGDPIAFADLTKIDTDYHPRAIVSSIMSMSPALAKQLSETYECPVLDLYAMTEVGIIAVNTELGHEVLPHDLYVEIVDESGRPVPDGVRGEITVSCNRNPYMPLLRYRTGDFASIRRLGSRSILVGLEGRTPVRFPLPSGRIVHSMEVTRLMREHPLLQYRLIQNADGGFDFGYRGWIEVDKLYRQLNELLEHPNSFDFHEMEPNPTSLQKVCEYRSDFRPQSV